VSEVKNARSKNNNNRLLSKKPCRRPNYSKFSLNRNSGTIEILCSAITFKFAHKNYWKFAFIYVRNSSMQKLYFSRLIRDQTFIAEC
jgi:hypothetical protein